MKFDGIIIVLSYPDTIVRPAYSEFSSKIWPKFGIGNDKGVQAGHAALMLIHKKTNQIDYFDFGRYITTYGAGRVRSKETDPELTVPFKAEIKNGNLLNLNEILLWLDANPEKTHGEGRLVASVNSKIDYTKAITYINNLKARKEVPYGVLVKNGSNCARFVADTVLNSCGKKSVVIKLKGSNLLTPSPIGNAIKAKSEKEIFSVNNQVIENYTNRSVLKEYSQCFFNDHDIELNLKGTELPNEDLFNLENATWLGGIGSGAWFRIESKEDVSSYRISRYTAKGEKDFEGVFKSENQCFDINKSYSFVHPSNCEEAFVEQESKEFKLTRISS